ncbi:MAG: trigger factor [bacterium]
MDENLKVTVQSPSEVERTLEVEIPRERVQKTADLLFRKISRETRVPGFRKGKAPINLLKRHIKKDTFRKDLAEELVPKAFMEALEKENLTPLTHPHFDLKPFEEGELICFKASFEVKPAFELGEYKGLEITQERPALSEKDVEDTLQEIRERMARLVSVEEDRPLENSDLASVDFESFEDGKPVEHGKAENQLVELKEELFLPGFLDNLLGMRKGEKKNFEVTFPEDYPTDLKGRRVTFKFHLKEIKKKVLPDLNDEFAREIGKHTTIKEWRDALRRQLEEQVERIVNDQVYNKILDLLARSNEMPVPPSMIAYKKEYLTDDYLRQLRPLKISLIDYLEQKGIKPEEFEAQLDERARHLAKIELIIDAIAEREKISVENTELAEEITHYAAMTNQDPLVFRENMERDGTLNSFMFGILRKKVMAFLLSVSKVVFTEADRPSTEKQPEKAAIQE